MSEPVAERIAATIRQLAAPPFSDRTDAVSRHAFTLGFEATVAHVAGEFAREGMRVGRDPVGTFWAERGDGPWLGVGSHLDSVRRGGPWDGPLGVLVALELCRHAPELPIRAVAWVEEEGAGFGQMLLGSRICVGEVDAALLEDSVLALDDGRPFAVHARAAGFAPEQCAKSAELLDGMAAWVEPHIEQARTLEQAGARLGVVDTVVGYVQGDLQITGRADHAGTTPMHLRRDAGLLAAEVMLRLEELAGGDVVATVGELALEPGVVNVVPGVARISVDIRSRLDSEIDAVLGSLLTFAGERAVARGLRCVFHERSRRPATRLDSGVADTLEQAARALGEEPLRMVSGAAHDTMVLASRVPSAMLFIPCRDGLSHAPGESADPADAALATRVIAQAARTLVGGA